MSLSFEMKQNENKCDAPFIIIIYQKWDIRGGKTKYFNRVK